MHFVLRGSVEIWGRINWLGTGDDGRSVMLVPLDRQCACAQEWHVSVYHKDIAGALAADRFGGSLQDAIRYGVHVSERM